MNQYFIEVGVLLDKDNEEFSEYNSVYDNKYGYYDEDQYLKNNFKQAKKEVIEYVQKGIPTTYGIISEESDYSVESVIYSIMKNKDNEIIENFIKKGE